MWTEWASPEKDKNAPVCPICNQKFNANTCKGPDVRNHIKHLHKEADLFSSQKIDSISNIEKHRLHAPEKYENALESDVNAPKSDGNAPENDKNAPESDDNAPDINDEASENDKEIVHESKRPRLDCKNSFENGSEKISNENIKSEGDVSNYCQLCDCLFSEKTKLLLHIRTVHEKEKSFSCSTCDSVFAQKSHLMTHIMVVHKGKKLSEANVKKILEEMKSLAEKTPLENSQSDLMDQINPNPSALPEKSCSSGGDATETKPQVSDYYENVG